MSWKGKFASESWGYHWYVILPLQVKCIDLDMMWMIHIISSRDGSKSQKFHIYAQLLHSPISLVRWAAFLSQIWQPSSSTPVMFKVSGVILEEHRSHKINNSTKLKEIACPIHSLMLRCQKLKVHGGLQKWYAYVWFTAEAFKAMGCFLMLYKNMSGLKS